MFFAILAIVLLASAYCLSDYVRFYWYILNIKWRWFYIQWIEFARNKVLDIMDAFKIPRSTQRTIEIKYNKYLLKTELTVEQYVFLLHDLHEKHTSSE